MPLLLNVIYVWSRKMLSSDQSGRKKSNPKKDILQPSLYLTHLPSPPRRQNHPFKVISCTEPLKICNRLQCTYTNRNVQVNVMCFMPYSVHMWVAFVPKSLCVATHIHRHLLTHTHTDSYTHTHTLHSFHVLSLVTYI